MMEKCVSFLTETMIGIAEEVSRTLYRPRKRTCTEKQLKHTKNV